MAAAKKKAKVLTGVVRIPELGLTFGPGQEEEFEKHLAEKSKKPGRAEGKPLVDVAYLEEKGLYIEQTATEDAGA